MSKSIKGLRIELTKHRATVFEETHESKKPLKTVVEKGEIVVLDWKDNQFVVLKTKDKSMVILKIISDIPRNQFLKSEITECDCYEFLALSNITLMGIFQ